MELNEEDKVNEVEAIADDIAHDSYGEVHEELAGLARFLVLLTCCFDERMETYDESC